MVRPRKYSIPSRRASISREALDEIPASYATVSLGTPDDDLEDKLKAIAGAGFVAIELGFPDLKSFATKFHGKDVAPNDYAKLCSAGEEVKKLCQKHNLGIMMLQPFSNFEGWRKGSKEQDDAFSRARGWIKIMEAVGTDMLQVGSSDSVGISSSFEELASDLRELADMLNEHGFKLAYENWCWATHAPRWKDVWEIVRLVDRPNVGLCLDTFQTAGGEFGDPTSDCGMVDTAGIQYKLEMNFHASLLELARTVPAEKIFVLQISDAYKPAAPLEADNPETGLGSGEEASKQGGARARARWSMGSRPYPFSGGYLPVTKVAQAVLETGFRGWFSMEVFDGGPSGKTFTKPEKFDEFCKGAMESHKKLLLECSAAD